MSDALAGAPAPVPPLTPLDDAAQGRSFRALTLAQLLGALNDNVFKQTIILLADPNTMSAALNRAFFDAVDMEPKALCGAVFSLPFILFGALGGSMADRFSKSASIKLLKLIEVFVMAAGVIAFRSGSVPAILLVLFLMGTQSAFFGPCKYGVLPEILPVARMSKGNAVIQATTYAAIIVGTIVAGVCLDALGAGYWVIGLVCVVLALMGHLSANRMAPLPASDPTRPYVWNTLGGLIHDMRDARKDRELVVSLLLGGLFLHVAGLLVFGIIDYSNTLAFTEKATGASVLNGLLAIGLVAGSVAAHRLSTSAVRPGLAVLGLGGVALGLAALVIPFREPTVPAALLFFAGTSAGVYLVPLRTIIQLRPDPQEKGRYMGTAQIVDFSALLLASGVYHVLVRTLGLGPHATMLVIGSLAAAGGAVLFSSSRLYLQGVPELFRRSRGSLSE